MTKPGSRKSSPGEPTEKLSRRPRRGGILGLWQTNIGKKWVMAVTGLLMMAFLLLHMLGNLKILYGRTDFDSYAHFLRTIGEPVLHGAWYLWIQRAVLTLALVLHITAAAQLSRRDQKARPVKYAHGQRPQATWATHTMRWGGVVLGLFIVWHILDLSAGVTNPDFQKDKPYHNTVVDFQHWWVNVIYIVAMIGLGLHINHGFWSASQTLGINSPSKDKAIKATGSVLAVLISAGFIFVPVGVMTGLIS